MAIPFLSYAGYILKQASPKCHGNQLLLPKSCETFLGFGGKDVNILYLTDLHSFPSWDIWNVK